MKITLPALALCASFAVCLTTNADTLKKPAVDQLLADSKVVDAPSFSAFLAEAARAQPSLKVAAKAYAQQSPLSGDNLVNIARLLGVYGRIHNQQPVIELLGKMVAFPTVMAPNVPQHESAAIRQFGQLVESVAKDFGLEYRNIDNRIFEVTLRGLGSDEFGILTHSDVVPVVPDEWVLADGTKLDPFKVTRVGNNLYGRGTIDDKGSIASVLYAMRDVKASGIPIARSVRLMIETTEETNGEGIAYYRDRVKLPEYNVVLDSKYPAVTAEKGSGRLAVSFPRIPVDKNITHISAMSAAASVSTIPQTAVATLQGGDLTRVRTVLEAAREGFIREHEKQGGTFSIGITSIPDKLEVKVTGISAHGSRPEEGVNPLPRLALFLQLPNLALAENQYTTAMRYITDLYGVDYLGKRMDVGYRDDFMGPLTLSPTMIGDKDGSAEVVVNVRMPRGKTPEELTKSVKAKISAWSADIPTAVTINYQQGAWMARDPKGAWLSTLLNVFGETTGLDSKPVPTAGSTTAKLLPNAINFGPAMPGKKYTAHNANEFKEVPDLDTDMQMFIEMLVRIGNLPQMQ